MSEQDPGKTGEENPVLSPSDVRELVESQSREHALKLKELEVHQQELNFQASHASEALRAQAQDRREIREHVRRVERNKLIFILLLVLLLLCFSAWAMAVGKDAIVMDILKVIFGFVGGLGVGVANRNQKKKDEKD